MIINGTVQCETITGGGTATNGDTIPAIPTWGEPIECNIKASSGTGRYEDGVFKIPSYEVLIETQDFAADRVQLTDSRNTVLGAFQVQDIQFLDFAGMVKIRL